MPELPEVETLVRLLRPELEGKRLLTWRAIRPGVRRPFPAEAPIIVPRCKIRRVWRRGKYLLLDLGPRWLLHFHLGMTGHLRICPASEPLDTHDHLVCGLEGRRELRFNDPRRFGTIALYRKSQKEPLPAEIVRLGPEPLEPGFKLRTLRTILARSARPIKSLLLDQESLAGLGNIYSCEALFQAGIHPSAPASGLPLQRTRALHRAIRATLERAIAAGSTIPPDKLNKAGEPEPLWFPLEFFVYGREGEPCRRCRSTAIRRLVLAGRGTFLCPHCQPE